MCHVWESSKLVGFILTIMFINATLIVTILNDSLEEPDSLMSKLFTSTWANFVKEVMIVKIVIIVVDDNSVKGRPFIWGGRLESREFRKSRVFPHEGRHRSNGQVLIELLWFESNLRKKIYFQGQFPGLMIGSIDLTYGGHCLAVNISLSETCDGNRWNRIESRLQERSLQSVPTWLPLAVWTLVVVPAGNSRGQRT